MKLKCGIAEMFVLVTSNLIVKYIYVLIKVYEYYQYRHTTNNNPQYTFLF